MKKWQIEEEKDRKIARNRVYQLIKKNGGYFKNATGKYIERISYCTVCERERVPIRALEDGACPFCICPACARDYQACATLLSMKNSK
jgi:hypothetical protein